MSTRENRRIPARLEKVRGRFVHWRRTRKVRTRIPEPLWVAAVKVAAKYGIHRTAKVLRVDYYRLKKRVEEDAAGAASVGRGAGFVELPVPLPTRSGECLIEWEDVEGAKMRMHLTGCETPDAAALGRSFWSDRP
jgi:hypothetical protein